MDNSALKDRLQVTLIQRVLILEKQMKLAQEVMMNLAQALRVINDSVHKDKC